MQYSISYYMYIVYMQLSNKFLVEFIADTLVVLSYHLQIGRSGCGSYTSCV